MSASRAAAPLLLSLLLAGRAAAETDYLPDNSSWNGLSELTAVARGMQISVELVDALGWDTLTTRDVLLLIYPRRQIQVEQLLSFLRRGGRAIIADDFGGAAAALERLGLQLARGAIESRYLHDANPKLPIALATRVRSPLTRGVRGLVTNHPAFFRAPSSKALAGFSARQQLLASGSFGRGSFVALADPSVLINAMLSFDGNMAFATNLLRETCRGRDRLLVLTGHFAQSGSFAEKADPKRRIAGELNKLLDRMNDFALTDIGMRVLAFVFGGLVLTGLLLVLPFPRRDLDGRWLSPRRAAPAASDALTAAAMLREEVEELLTEALAAPGHISTIHPRWLLERVERQIGGEAAEKCHKLLSALSRVPYTTRGDVLPLEGGRISRKELAAIYERSRDLLEIVGSSASLPRVSEGEDVNDRR